MMRGWRRGGARRERGGGFLVAGDMGIGNTTPAACLISAFTGSPPGETTGRGTGIDDETLKLKVSVVEEALELHKPDPADPLGVLARIGGLEHAAIVGVILAGAVYRVPVILDGVVSDSAALVASALAPRSADTSSRATAPQSREQGPPYNP